MVSKTCTGLMVSSLGYMVLVFEYGVPGFESFGCMVSEVLGV